MVNKVKSIMENCMNEAYEKLGLDVPFKVEIRIQKSWG